MGTVRTACLILALGWAAALGADKKQGIPDQDLTKLFESRLERIRVPAAEFLRERGQVHAYPGVTKEQVWNSLIKVLIQNGIIVHSDRAAGVMVAVTHLVTRGPGQESAPLAGDATPLCNTLDLLVAEEAGGARVYLKADKPVNRVLFEKLSVQLEAGARWPYLDIRASEK
jgi:hypothetical protein